MDVIKEAVASGVKKPVEAHPRTIHNYKQLKEAHVSNLSGGSIWEINEVTLVLPAAVFLWSVLQSRQRFFTPYTVSAAVVDFLINCAAILFAITAYADYPKLLVAFLVSPAVLLLLSSASNHGESRRKGPAKPSSTIKSASTKTAGDAFPIKPFVTMYRGHMMIITCAAILAVDFNVFPRRFAKVENWGTSLMDMGVGSFVFSAGVVSARSVLKARASGQTSSSGARLRDAIRHSFPLLVLGLVRLYTVKGVDYAEHVTEYGVHWNFFFTLGFLPPFMAICHTAFSIVPSYALLALVISGGYELVLNMTTLKAFIFTAPRVDLLSQNREGIFSLFGYLAIFLAGHDTGMSILPRTRKIAANTSLVSKQGVQQLLASTPGKLIVRALIWIVLLAATMSYHGFNLHVSRRLANLPYFLWVAAFNCGQLAVCASVEALCFPDIYQEHDVATERKKCTSATSRLLHAINRNGLAIFLVANLLTGAVNLSMKTLYVGDMKAMGVLLGYIALLSVLALGLDAKNISIKL